MKKTFMAPCVCVRAVRNANIITTSNVNVGDKLEGTESHPVIDDAAAPTRSYGRNGEIRFRN